MRYKGKNRVFTSPLHKTQHFSVKIISGKVGGLNLFSKNLKLFQRSENSIWTDEYISKELLKCHLDESMDGASRTLEKRNKILNFINRSINKNSKILDLGCGPGLLDFELAKFGHKILGVDFNIESINYAVNNKQSNNIEYKYENYLTGTFPEKYDAILMIYCDFGALIPNEQITVLKNIYDALKDDGVFIFDVFKSDLKTSRKEQNSWNISNGNDFWCKDPYIILKEVKIFDKENAIGERYFVINQNKSTTKEFILWNQYYNEDSISKLMSDNNFDVKSINENLISGENSMFVIAKKHNK